MKSKIVCYKGDMMNYPVGLNLMSNMKIIKLMARKLNLLYGKTGKEIIFWTRGSSGAIIASVTATFLKHNECYINHVKKEGESSHSSNQMRVDANSINIIIDDFICTGDTIKKIIEAFNSNYTYGSDKKIDCLCISDSINKELSFLDKFDSIVCSK